MARFEDDLDVLTTELLEALLSVNRLAVKNLLTRPYPDMSRISLIENLVVPVLDQIGKGWENGDYALSQVYMSGRICEEIVDLILPPSDLARRSQPKVAIVALEDYHQLGKRIVYSTLRASGIELQNYGRLETQALANKALDEQVKILLISVLMLPSALKVKELCALLNESDQKIRVIVGGAPFRFDRQLWREVGADDCGVTAADAVDIVFKMMEEVG